MHFLKKVSEKFTLCLLLTGRCLRVPLCLRAKSVGQTSIIATRLQENIIFGLQTINFNLIMEKRLFDAAEYGDMAELAALILC